MAEVLRTLEAKGHHVNASCGVHVHVGWKRDLVERRLGPPGHDRRLRREGPLRDHRHEEPRARTRYCGGVRKYGNDKEAKPNLDRNRYHALNLTNLARGTKDTVEFRVFSGSLSADEGRRMDPGLPGVGGTGLERQADADLEPEAAFRRLEEGRRRARARPNA